MLFTINSNKSESNSIWLQYLGLVLFYAHSCNILNRTGIQVIAMSPSSKVCRCQGKGDFRHFQSSELYTNGTDRLASYDFFLPRELCSARYMPWSCVRLSVTSRCSTKMAKHRNMQTMPHDSPTNLVF